MAGSLEQFQKQVLQNPALAEQFKAVSSPDEFANLAVMIGQQMGYSFTAEEVKAALTQQPSSASLELSDAQLESVAGGAYPGTHPTGCGCVIDELPKCSNLTV